MDRSLISIVFCSISPERYKKCTDNIASTIGVPVEFVRIDNLEYKWPIAKAYNEGAKRASSDCLLFLHEDVEFEHHGWGKALVEKLHEPTTGVVGFIGSRILFDAIGPWCMSGSNYGHVIGVRDGRVEVMRYHEFSEKDSQMFVHVAIVDGLGMAVRKDVWAEHPFDEAMLTGFHCYDIDFSLTISMAGYRNYAYTFGIIHFSRGSYEEQWLATTYKMLVEKWSPKLPYGVDGSLKDIDVDGLSASLDYDHIFRFFRKGISKSLARKMVHRYLRKCRHSRAYRSHMAVVCWRYLCKYAFKK